MSELRARLPTPLRRFLWNLKYGIIGYPKSTAPNDILKYFSATLDRHASLLDLAAGRGSLLRGLRAQGWVGPFCGVELSRKAIQDAQRIGDHRSTWIVSDIEGFRSNLSWDVVTFVESVYYINPTVFPEVMHRVVGMLEPNGRVLIRLNDVEKHREYLKTILQLFPHTETIGAGLFCIPNPREGTLR
jgi:2-polyprenyl-3-methyl-5-hydroxy-6-metoxy-1,4-benzoquinol methylase